MLVDSDLEKFSKLVKAIEPWLDQVVVIGGWAHRLYRLHPLAHKVKYAPLMTMDADIAIPAKLPSSDADIAIPSKLNAPKEGIGKLLHHAGFQESLLGDHKPPVSQYRLGAEAGGFYVEFLSPLTGSRYKRGGKPDSTVRVAGVTAQKLRNIDILLLAPWTIKLEASETEVRIANPAGYLAQKLLIHAQRETADRAKDLLYIHDTIDIFVGSLPEIHAEWTEKIAPELYRNVMRDVSKAAAQLFHKVNDDIRSAAEIARSLGRTLAPERLFEVCQAGLAEIFDQ